MRYTAATALPYEHLERATAIIRRQIAQQIALAGIEEAPEWSRLEITGPTEDRDFDGRPWFWYSGTLIWPSAG